MTSLPAFSRLNFGRRDAHDEAANEPQLLRYGFYDYRNAAARVEARSAFLILGPKGAGKSAILEHLGLKWADCYDRFFKMWDLRGFPVSDVRNVKTGQTPGLTRTQSSWELLILLKLIDSLRRDNALRDTPNYAALLDALTQSGLLSGEWNSRVVSWSRSTVKVKASVFEAGAELERRNKLHLLEVVELLRRTVGELAVRNRHLLALDGIDAIYVEGKNQWESLAGLVQAVESLNRFFQLVEQPLQVICALRSDIFQRATHGGEQQV